MPTSNDLVFQFGGSDFMDNTAISDIFASEDGDEVLSDLVVDNSQFDGVEIEAAAPLPKLTQADLAAHVEDQLIDLLGTDNRVELLVLTGEDPNLTGAVAPEILNDFAVDFANASFYNPALRWYGKLVKMCAPAQFCCMDGNLTLRLPLDKFRKILLPFLGDFRANLREESPLVSLVLSLAESVDDEQIKKRIQEVTGFQEGKMLAEGDYEDNLSPSKLDFSDAQLPDSLADLGISPDAFGDDTVDLSDNEVTTAEDADDGGGDPPGRKLDISLNDLSNKVVAEHLDQQELTVEQIEEYLADQGFQKARANEIIGIIKYMRLNKSMEARMSPKGNRGGGNIDFIFGM